MSEWLALVKSDAVRNPFWEERLTLGIWRFGQVVHRRPGAGAFALRRVHSVLDQLWVRNTIGAELPRSVQAGPGLRMPHSGRGVVLHPSAKIGAGVTIYHRVTVGVRHREVPPTISDGVFLGVGASVIGPVTVGSGAKVGAHALVLEDVPEGTTVVGVPARAVIRSPTPTATVASMAAALDLAARTESDLTS